MKLMTKTELMALREETKVCMEKERLEEKETLLKRVDHILKKAAQEQQKGAAVLLIRLGETVESERVKWVTNALNEAEICWDTRNLTVPSTDWIQGYIVAYWEGESSTDAGVFYDLYT